MVDTSQLNTAHDDIETTCSKVDNQLLDIYLQHQEEMQIQAKTSSALKEKIKAPSTRKQMFDILKGKGLYKKFPQSHFKKFERWLKSPSGGQLKCTDQIVSEVNR